MQRPAFAQSLPGLVGQTEGKQVKPKTAILLALHAAPAHTAGNDDIRRSMGRPDMPQCTVTWHLNELADAGAVECDRMGRYNRWTLTEYGRELALAAARHADRVVGDKLAQRIAPRPTSATVSKVLQRAPRSVFDLALLAAQKHQRTPAQDLQLKLWGV